MDSADSLYKSISQGETSELLILMMNVYLRTARLFGGPGLPGRATRPDWYFPRVILVGIDP